MPYNGVNTVIKVWKYNRGYLATIKMEKQGELKNKKEDNSKMNEKSELFTEHFDKITEKYK